MASIRRVDPYLAARRVITPAFLAACVLRAPPALCNASNRSQDGFQEGWFSRIPASAVPAVGLAAFPGSVGELVLPAVPRSSRRLTEDLALAGAERPSAR